MQTLKGKIAAPVLSIACAAFLMGACGAFQSAETTTATVFVPPAAPLAPDAATNDGALRFLENKVKNDPEDSSANNKLAGLYLQKLRETGNVQYLDLTFRAAHASLSSVPEVRNSGGLAALALCEYASHDFTNARDHAIRLIELEPTKSYPQGILGDALLELGEYEKAEIAYKKNHAARRRHYRRQRNPVRAFISASRRQRGGAKTFCNGTDARLKSARAAA